MKPHFRVYTCSQLRADLENAETSYRIGRETVDFTLNELKAKLRELEKQVRLRIISLQAEVFSFTQATQLNEATPLQVEGVNKTKARREKITILHVKLVLLQARLLEMERRHTHEKHELQQLVFVGLDMLMEHKQQLHNVLQDTENQNQWLPQDCNVCPYVIPIPIDTSDC